MLWGRFASRASEARYPQLWQGRVFGVCPSVQGPAGLNVYDLTGRNQNGTLTNFDLAADWQRSAGRFALNFDATDNTVTISGGRTYIAAGQPMTASIWFFNRAFTSPFPKLLMLRSDCGGNNAYEIGLSNSTGYTGVLIGTATSYARLKTDTAAESLTGSWQHVAVAYNGGTRSSASSFTVYLNGIVRATSAALAFSATTNATSLGLNATFNRHDGLLDDVTVFNRPLTAGEIRLLATRRGIAYEARRDIAFGAAGNRRRRILCGDYS